MLWRFILWSGVLVLLVACTSSADLPSPVPAPSVLPSGREPLATPTPPPSAAALTTPAEFLSVTGKTRSMVGDMVVLDIAITSLGVELVPYGEISLNSDTTVELVDASSDRHTAIKPNETHAIWVKVRLTGEGIHRLEVVFPFHTPGFGPVNGAHFLFFSVTNTIVTELSPTEYDSLQGR